MQGIDAKQPKGLMGKNHFCCKFPGISKDSGDFFKEYKVLKCILHPF